MIWFFVLMLVGVVLLYKVLSFDFSRRNRGNSSSSFVMEEDIRDLNEFAVKVTLYEHGKKQCSIAQVKEILRVIDILTDGAFYPWLKKRFKGGK